MKERQMGTIKWVSVVLLTLSLLGCESPEQKAQRLDAERQAQAQAQAQKAETERQAQAQKAEAERQTQAAEAARKLREELGDEIVAHVAHWGKGGNVLMIGFVPPGPIRPEAYEEVEEGFGFRIKNLKMFIKRSTGTLTIIFDCHFLGQKHGFSDELFMIRLFDENGEYLTHLSTSDVFALPNTEDPKGRPFLRLKAENNILQYRVSRRFADYTQRAEFGLLIDHP
jgi:multidrug efflux pump subunit AcrA (membrane-fusion protein)